METLRGRKQEITRMYQDSVLKQSVRDCNEENKARLMEMECYLNSMICLYEMLGEKEISDNFMQSVELLRKARGKMNDVKGATI